MTSNHSNDSLANFPGLRIYEDEIKLYISVINISGFILLVLGILSNLFVCIVLLKNKQHTLQSFANFLILQLAISDLVFRVVGIYSRVAEHTTKGFMTAGLCKSLVFLQYTCCASVFGFLSGIAVDRYRHILYPIRSFNSNPNRLLVALAVWLSSALVSIGFIFSARQQHIQQAFNIPNPSKHRPLPTMANLTTNTSTVSYLYKSKAATCIVAPPTIPSQVAITIFFVFAFVAPLVIMSYCYSRILVFLRQRASVHSASAISTVSARSKRKAVRLLLLVVLSFLLSWGPLMIVDVLQSFRVKELYKVGYLPLRPMCQCICFTSSIINPALYAFGSAEFNDSFKRLLCVNRVRRMPRGVCPCRSDKYG